MPALFDPGFIKMLKRPAPIEDTFGLRDKPVFRNNDPPPSLWTRLKNDVKSSIYFFIIVYPLVKFKSDIILK